MGRRRRGGTRAAPPVLIPPPGSRDSPDQVATLENAADLLAARDPDIGVDAQRRDPQPGSGVDGSRQGHELALEPAYALLEAPLDVSFQIRLQIGHEIGVGIRLEIELVLSPKSGRCGGSPPGWCVMDMDVFSLRGRSPLPCSLLRPRPHDPQKLPT